MSTNKRITKEYAEITQEPLDGIAVSLPPDDSIHTWHITITGPRGSIYEDGKFGILLTLPTDYPFKPPVVRFVTRIYHPNVTNDSLGSVCLGLLKPEFWKPSIKIRHVLEALRNLLVEPNPDDPLEDRIAEEFRNNLSSFTNTAKLMIKKYATAEPAFPVKVGS